ncbi:gluconokinase [Chelativorans sp. M5D2P16]|uniref:gluconokinase n=1 Tax=Chelativorans sp. M5D2P16 TaxID=3095678 RepID=UPI002ACA2677|nr:gluconokinase [Chelativorans sp. M5D2P16]MDZ5699524.1 gluconokinase [Chelativorans sp. M5D2P16]
MSKQCRNVLVMGVCGVGKSTIARRLAESCHGRFVEGDGFHSPENVRAMSSGVPLTDAQRWDWLGAICSEVERLNAGDPRPVFIACSALKKPYRALLSQRVGPIAVIHLDGEPTLIRHRLAARSDHFMPPSLLESQLNDLQAPDGEEGFPLLRLDVADSVGVVVQAASGFCRRHVANVGSNGQGPDPAGNEKQRI